MLNQHDNPNTQNMFHNYVRIIDNTLKKTYISTLNNLNYKYLCSKPFALLELATSLKC